MKDRPGAATVIGALAAAVAGVAISEIRAGRGLCLLGRHDWWYCESGVHDLTGEHRHCRRCGAGS